MRMQCNRCLSSSFTRTENGCAFCEGKDVVRTPISVSAWGLLYVTFVAPVQGHVARTIDSAKNNLTMFSQSRRKKRK